MQVSRSQPDGIRKPDLRCAREWLAGHDLTAETSEQVEQAIAEQNDDGSWGDHGEPRGRILASLWMTKTLAELGYASDPAVDAAGQFLTSAASSERGVFSIDGQRSGVLSCYVGIAAGLYAAAGLDEQANAQVEWILRYQDVKCGGVSRRENEVGIWSDALTWRYGGCLASTSCLIGLVKTGIGLLAWRERSGSADADALLGQMAEALLEREVFKSTSGTTLPLGTPPRRANDWLLPTFPLDWRVDLIEALHLVAHVLGNDSRMEAAVAIVGEQQLTDGAWPLRRTFRPDHLPLLERRSQTAGSTVITRRVVNALERRPS